MPRTVEVQGHLVIKTDPVVERIRNEVIRTTAARAVAAEVGMLVPTVVSSGSTCIAFERLQQFNRLDDTLSAHPNGVATLLRSMGALLGRIHRSLPVLGPGAPPQAPRSACDAVGIHGDYVVSNLGLADGLPVVLDWAPADWVHADAMLSGPPEWDLSMFLISLYMRRPGDPRPIAGLGHGARDFLEGYRCARPIDLAALPAFYRWMLRRALPNERGWPRRISRTPQLLHGYCRVLQESRR